MKGTIIAAVIGMLLGGSVGTYIGYIFYVKPCPACNCPQPEPCPPAIDLQGFDVGKLNNKKGSFTYSPQLNNVHITISDTNLFKRAVKEALHRR
jgi:hypothetical protein